jgi:perosamine synthetase
MIPLFVPEISGNEWKYIKECLDTNWVSSVGPYVNRFEKNVANCVGSKFGIATVNGTAALHVALLVSGVEPGDEVLVPTLTFIAPVNAIRYCDANPVFFDAEPTHLQMDIDRVEQFLRNQCIRRGRFLKNRKTGRFVTTILAVHILGHSLDIDRLKRLAKEFRLTLIEDACEGMGATYKGRALGSMGDFGCFSFNGNKIITTGGGGVIVTPKSNWAKRAKHLTTQAKQDGVEYRHTDIGYNYRLSNVSAAIGCAQLERLAHFVSKKRKIAATYIQAFSRTGIEPIEEPGWSKSSYWLFTVRVNTEKYRAGSRLLMAKLAKAGIQTRPLWQPIHLSPMYRRYSCCGGHIAEKAYRECLSLPCSSGLTKKDQQLVIDTLLKEVQ